jgi:chemotaxis methyl-accepting protein methylase
VEPISSQKHLEEALAEEFGWAPNAANREIISTAVTNKAQRLGVSTQDYCQLAANPSELLALVEETAIGATSFFREPQQFAFLRLFILPALLRQCPPDRQLRLWSAACSTGEEAYSLAITVNQVQPQTQQDHLEILATDVRNRALLEASRAQYPVTVLGAVDEATRAQFFEPVSGAEDIYQVAQMARRLVVFRRLNLFDRMYWRGAAERFDLILCANLLKMLSGAAARQLVLNISGALRTGGYLMVAPDETALIRTSKLSALADEPSFFSKN